MSQVAEDIMEISMGPQHPSTHGVFRMDVRLEGERVLRLKPVFGYLHRNHEKIAENASYLAAIPYTDRLDYLCSMTNNWGYALAVESHQTRDVGRNIIQARSGQIEAGYLECHADRRHG